MAPAIGTMYPSSISASPPIDDSIEHQIFNEFKNKYQIHCKSKTSTFPIHQTRNQLPQHSQNSVAINDGPESCNFISALKLYQDRQKSAANIGKVVNNIPKAPPTD